MATFKVGKDFETSEGAGAGGMYQVDTLIDDNEIVVTARIDVGRHFSDDEEIKINFSEIFEIPIEDIDIDTI